MNDKNLLTGFAIALLIYSGWRTWDYMSRFLLQDVSVTESMIIGAMFLVVTELGYLFWLHKGQPNATTDRQEITATLLIYIDLFGSLIIGFADLLVHNTLYDVNISALDPILLATPWILVGANLIGYTIYRSNDSLQQLDRADRKLKHKEVEFEIAARMKAIEEATKNQAATIERLAPHYLKHLIDQVEGRTANRFVRQAEKLAKVDVKVIEPEKLVASTNGDEVEEVVVNGRKGNPTKR